VPKAKPLFLTRCARRLRSAIQRPRHLRRQMACAALLAPVFLGIYYLGFCLRFDGELDREHLELFIGTCAVVVLIKCIVFGACGVYRGWGRHVTFPDLVMLAEAITGSSLVMVLVDYLLFTQYSIPRSVFLMDWGGMLVIVGTLRATSRLVQETRRRLLQSGRSRALIVGADQCGETLLRALRLNPSVSYFVVGFISQSTDKLEGAIAGLPVLGTLDETCAIAERLGVTTILVAGELSGRQSRRIIEQCRAAAIDVRILPTYDELIRGSVELQPRPVAIEDLLRREPVLLEMNKIRRWIDGRVVMVTGSAGSIGSEVCRQLLRFSPKQLVLIDRWENGQFHLGRELEGVAGGTELRICIADINDDLRMRTLLMSHRPEILFHAAAYKHVPLMEANPGEAIKNTALASCRLARLANEFSVGSFVMVSTDKAVNPTNIMGACKRVAELFTQSLAENSRCRFVTVRFGNVLDSAGSVVPIFRQQIARGGPVTVTDPRMERYFMTIPEAAQLVIQAGTMGKGGEIFVLDMGEPVRIVDLATDMIRLSGLRVDEDIEIVFVGLRPGEKLYEELHITGEEHLPTRHPKIQVARRKEPNHAAIADALMQLEAVAEQPADIIKAELQRIVAEYQPQVDDAADGESDAIRPIESGRSASAAAQNFRAAS